MNKKQNEHNDGSCWNKAYADEEIFILRAKDPEAPAIIREWAMRRINKGLNQITDFKIQEALLVAHAMDEQRKDIRGRQQ